MGVTLPYSRKIAKSGNRELSCDLHTCSNPDLLGNQTHTFSLNLSRNRANTCVTALLRQKSKISLDRNSTPAHERFPANWGCFQKCIQSRLSFRC
jgi:hypothetical protein